MQAALQYRSFCVLVVIAVIASLVVLEAPHADAATSQCKVTAEKPQTDGVIVWSGSKIDCSDVDGTNAVKIRGRIQEKVGPVFITRVTSYDYGNTSWLRTYTEGSCNGHGTDVWRTRATGYDSNEESRSKNSGDKTLTC